MKEYRGRTNVGDFFKLHDRLYLEISGDNPFEPNDCVEVGGRTFVRWTSDTFSRAQQLGLLAPHPVFADYDWPGGEPFAAQVHTAEFLLFHERAFVLSEMGTGKTRAALYAFDALRTWRAKTEKCETRGLIVAPLSTLVPVWAHEIERVFCGRLTVVVLHGTSEQRLRRLRTPGWDLAVINHDYVAPLLRHLRAAKFHVVIVDEIAAFRNPKAVRSAAMRALATGRVGPAKIVGPPVRWVWGMTGTPTPTAPTDAWGIKRIVRADEAGSFVALRRATMTPAAGPAGILKWVPQPGWHSTISSYLTPAVRFTRAEMLDLPPVTWSERATTLTPEQRLRLRELQRHARTIIESSSVTAANAAVVVQKHLQICLGTVISDDGTVKTVDAHPRDSLLLDLVTAAPEKVLVFAAFRAAVVRVTETLRRAGVSTVCVHGDVAAAQRERIFQAFQTTPEPRVIVAHPATMSHGLTLTAATTIVWFGPIWSAEVYSQACARITRIGQTSPAHIIDIYASKVEKRAYELVRSRLTEQDVLLGLFEKFVDEAGHF